MLDTIVDRVKEFREKIYHFFRFRRDAAMELVDSLASNTQANSVVELSLNPCHRRNYCSITRVLNEFYPSTESSQKSKQNKALTTLLSTAITPLKKRRFHLFAVDCTPNPRVFSPTLEDRGFVYAPNPITTNKPITIGHQYSIAAYLPEKLDESVPPWIIPLSCERIETSQKGILIGMEQINTCINSQPTFKENLCVSVGDCAYSHPNCLGMAAKNTHQVHISRARNNRNFYYPHLGKNENTAKRGRKKHYGDKHSLRDNSTWKEPNETTEFSLISKKGYPQIVKIESWDNLFMRGTRQFNLSHYPFRLLRVCVYKENGELLFKRPLWLIATGERRNELSLNEIFTCYRQRFDIEHFFRFGKERLLMNKIQTPDVHHEEAWWQVVIMAYAQLYLASFLAENTFRPWEKYSPALRSAIHQKSPTQTQRDFVRIIQPIGTPAAPPKPRKNPPGRKKGDVQPRRKHHPVIKKKKTEHPIAITA